MAAPHRALLDREQLESANGRVNWWLRLTSAGWQKPQETIQEREIARRSRLVSWITLGMLISMPLFIPAALADKAATVIISGALVGVLIILLFNRKGHIIVAGSLLVLLNTVSAMSIIIFSPDHMIHLVYLPAYDFLVLPVILGASVLPRISAFFIAALDICILYADFLLQPRSADLSAAINAYGSVPMGVMVLTGRPVAILVITTVIAYLWVRGMDKEVERADQEKELRTLEKQFADAEARRTEQVEQFVQETINAINALANGQEGMVLLAPDHPWLPQATFINQQLKQFFKLKQNRGNDQVGIAAETLLRALQRINNNQASISSLDPHRFTTALPVINEIARYLYFMLQNKQAPILPGINQFGNQRFERF